LETQPDGKCVTKSKGKSSTRRECLSHLDCLSAAPAGPPVHVTTFLLAFKNHAEFPLLHNRPTLRKNAAAGNAKNALGAGKK
jgi:hypothetical protein